MSDSLEHYGILGMKWGVRRTPEQLGHKTISKSAYKSGMYNRADDEDFTIPKNTKLYRVSYSDKDPSKGLYVTRSKMDRNFYKTGYSNSIMGLGESANNLKERTYTTNEDLRIPSFDKRKEAFNQIAKDPKVRKAIANDYAVGWIKANAAVPISSLKDAKDLLKSDELTPEAKKGLKALISGSSKASQLALKDIDSKKDVVLSARMMSKVIGASETARNAYIDILKKQGYNATVDDYGRKGLWGTKGETSEALILFNSSSANVKKSRGVTAYEQMNPDAQRKTKLTDLKYESKILKNPQSREQVRILGELKVKSVLAEVGGLALTPVTMGASYPISLALYTNAAAKANKRLDELEREKRENYK